MDSLEERQPKDAVFILGADQLAGFEGWKAPERVLELVRIAVAMRPGVSRDDVDAVRDRLSAPERVLEFEMAPISVSSSEIRARVARGDAIDDLVPAEGGRGDRAPRSLRDA